MVDDPLDFDEDEKKGPPGDQTLHTPGPKKTKPPPATLAVVTSVAVASDIATSMTTTTTKNERPMIQTTITTTPTTTKNERPMIQTTTAIVKAASAIPTSIASAAANIPKLATGTGTSHVLLTNRNILPKTATNKIIKIAPKSLSSTTTTTSIMPQATTAAATSVASLAGKAVKTSNGQIYYIQKKSNVLPAVRLQQAGTTTATGTSATTTAATSIAAVAATSITASATTTTAVATNASGNKTVAIQVIRAADGSLLPVKGGAATTLTAAAAAASGKKIISNVGGQVVIKTPLRTVAGISSAAAIANDATGKTVKLQRIATTSATTTTATTADSSSNIVPVTKTGGKIIVHSASGKQIVVSNQNLIKLSPNPTQQTTGATTGLGVTTVSAGVAGSATGKMLQLSGKPLPYVRVLPNSKLNSNANTTAAPATTANASTTSTATSNTAATAKSAIRILNPLPPQKFTVVRPSAATKLVLTQSPKTDGGVTFSPVTSKVQKTIVTLPTQSRTADDDKNSPTTTPTSSGGNNNSRQSLIRPNNNTNNNSATVSYASLIRKPKISEINSEIKRITTTASGNEHSSRSSIGSGGGPPEVKRNVSGNNIVVVSRSSNLPQFQPRSSLSSMVQGTHTNTYSNINQSPKKLYSVLKNSNTSSTSTLGGAFATNNNGERKSLLISVQEQGLITQQHHKSLQIKRQLQSSTLASSSLLHNSGNTNNNVNTNYNNNTNSSATSNNNKFIPMKIKEEPIDSNDVKPLLLDDGILRRKHCNCSKSQCLKLYCDCFANGEFCQDCTCKDCFNNLQYEDERQRAIKNCLERNPSAFKPKITTSRDSGDMRLHNKGCNCKRSGCLKNYCECYEAKIPCSSNCKCVGCRNIEERPDLDMDPIDPKILATIANASAAAQAGQKRSYDKANNKMGATAGVSDKMLKEAAKACTLNNDFISGSGSSTSITGSNSTTTAGGGGAVSGQPPEKQQCNFITQEVVDATIQCMLSQADECEKNGLPAYQTEKMVMEEMGRCLVEIIDFSIRNTDTSFSQE